MALDGGGHFIPADIDGFHTLSSLSASLVAHDRAAEDNHTHIGKEHKSTNTTNAGTVHKTRQGGINSAPL